MKQKRNGGQETKGSCVKFVSFNYFMCTNSADHFDWV